MTDGCMDSLHVKCLNAHIVLWAGLYYHAFSMHFWFTVVFVVLCALHKLTGHDTHKKYNVRMDL